MQEPDEPEIPEFLRGYKDDGPSWNFNTDFKPSEAPASSKPRKTKQSSIAPPRAVPRSSNLPQ